MVFLRRFGFRLGILRALAVRETHLLSAGSLFGWFSVYFQPFLMVAGFILIRPVIFGRFRIDSLEPVLFITSFLPFFMFTELVKKSFRFKKPLGGVFNFSTVSALDMFVTWAVVAWNRYMSLMTALIAACYLLGEKVDLSEWLYAIAGPLGLLFLGLGCGMTFWGLLLRYPYARMLLASFPRVLFWCSGILYSAVSLPPFLQEYMAWNPVFNCIEMLRFGVGLDSSSIFLRPGYAALISLAMLCLGSLLCRQGGKAYRR
ncbi:MAG: hypothetical protein FWG74_06230 [Planctomycetes bacterium]|nr:hypothetical protein [Planctomycetota bacterium]